MVKLDRRLERPGADVAFADTGASGAVVVLTHGAGVDHSMFDAQIPVLMRHGYRVVVWDLRGHGQSVLAPGARFTAADARTRVELRHSGFERLGPKGSRIRRAYPIGWAYVLGLYTERRGPLVVVIGMLTSALMALRARRERRAGRTSPRV